MISTVTCSPAGMSIPIAGSSITRFVALPVFTGVHAPEPEIFATRDEREVGGRRGEIVE